MCRLARGLREHQSAEDAVFARWKAENFEDEEENPERAQLN